MNETIRTGAKMSGVKLWMIAEGLGISDVQFSKLLRYELPDSKKEEVRRVISRLKEEVTYAEN